jgi:hypothetical protein
MKGAAQSRLLFIFTPLLVAMVIVVTMEMLMLFGGGLIDYPITAFIKMG